jgi:hypothetical protein
MLKLMLIALVAGSSAMAAPISCARKGSPYRLWVGNNLKTATLTINGQKPEFGDLTCRYNNHQLTCHSPHVADAGYGAVFTRQSPTDLTVQIGEFWIGGTRPVANLTCVQAMN